MRHRTSDKNSGCTLLLQQKNYSIQYVLFMELQLIPKKFLKDPFMYIVNYPFITYNQFKPLCFFVKVKKNIPNGNAGYVVAPAINSSGVGSRAGTAVSLAGTAVSRAGTAVSLARLGAGSASHHQQGGSATRRIVVESYRALPPERKDEFEIYAQNILRHSRLGNKTRPNRPSSRVIHSHDWQS